MVWNFDLQIFDPSIDGFERAGLNVIEDLIGR
jgi:hypothetical protein